LPIDSHVEEVSEITDNITTTAAQETTTLHWHRRRRIGSGPRITSIERVRDVQVPYSGKGGVVGIARRRPIRCGRAVERNRRTAGVSCRGRGEGDVVDPVCSTDVVHAFPRLSLILRDRHTGTGAVVRESEVDPARGIDAK